VLSDRRASKQGYGRATGVNDVEVYFVTHRGAAHTQNTVLTVQEYFAISGKVVCNLSWHANPKVHD
jgi:hypothetical protein